jgi:Zn-dependent M28 family amino/carboxypeptidase
VAHCDHVGIGEPSNGDAIYNGAVDNASGVSALLEIARTMAAWPPARAVAFLCTTGEEQGLIGARYFVAHRDILPGPIVAAINIDGTSIQTFNMVDMVDVRGGTQSSLGRSDARGCVGAQVPP